MIPYVYAYIDLAKSYMLYCSILLHCVCLFIHVFSAVSNTVHTKSFKIFKIQLFQVLCVCLTHPLHNICTWRNRRNTHQHKNIPFYNTCCTYVKLYFRFLNLNHKIRKTSTRVMTVYKSAAISPTILMQLMMAK